MICIFIILLSGWCRTRMRPARLVSNAFLYSTRTKDKFGPKTRFKRKKIRTKILELGQTISLISLSIKLANKLNPIYFLQPIVI